MGAEVSGQFLAMICTFLHGLRPGDNYNDTLIVSHLRLIKPFAIC